MNLISVWNDTKELMEAFYSEAPNSIKFNKSLLDKYIGKPRYYRTAVKVYNCDTFDSANIVIHKSKLNPMVLNMANHLVPGGGVRNGARAQEECLFRMSNYSATLTRDLYPLKDDEVIYSPEVTVFKKSNYELCEQWMCSCIAVAALRRTPAHNEIYNDYERDAMLLKIRMIFHLGLLQGHDSLVLGAFGCGAFHNPPMEVCSLFEQVINEYSGYYKKIVFAVKSTSDKNYDIFKLLDDHEINT